MLKLIQLVTGIGVGALLIWQREADVAAGIPTPLSNGYLIALLSVGAAFAVTALPIGLYNDIPRWYRRLWKREKPLRPEEPLHKRITRDGRGGLGK